MGRFRKGKKAYKKGNGCVPLWWTGSPRQQNLQARWYWFTLVKEWNRQMAINNAMIAALAAQAMCQAAMIGATVGMPPEVKVLKLAELQLDVARQAVRITEQIGPRPKLIDHIKPAFTT